MTIYFCGTEAPTEVPLIGQRMVGYLPVQYARTSALTRAVQFGGRMFGMGHTIEVNGVLHDIAALVVIERSVDGILDGTWHVSRYGGIRRLHTDGREDFPWERAKYPSYEDPSPSARAKIHEWAIETAMTLAEQHPGAFESYGFTDGDEMSHRTSTGMRLCAQRHADDAYMYASYAALASEVESGDARISSVLMGDTRWETPHARDEYGQLGTQQPCPIVGEIVSSNGELLGYAVDTGSRHSSDPDTGNGPLLIPLDYARPVAPRTTV